MKKIIYFILILTFFITPCFAEIYVLIDGDTKEVKGICEKNIAQIEEGMELFVLNGTINDLESYGYDKTTAHNKFENGVFKKDAAKISSEKQKMDSKKQNKQKAFDKLEDLGLTQNEIEALFGDK
jgi:hypothetical protein